MGPTFGALVNTFQKGHIWIRSQGLALLVTRTQILRMKKARAAAGWRRLEAGVAPDLHEVLAAEAAPCSQAACQRPDSARRPLYSCTGTAVDRRKGARKKKNLISDVEMPFPGTPATVAERRAACFHNAFESL